jgi:hypothetical protein
MQGVLEVVRLTCHAVALSEVEGRRRVLKAHCEKGVGTTYAGIMDLGGSFEAGLAR